MTLQFSHDAYEVEVLSTGSSTSSIYVPPLSSCLGQKQGEELLGLFQNNEQPTNITADIRKSNYVTLGNTHNTTINNIYKNHLLSLFRNCSKASWKVGTLVVLLAVLFATSLFFICEFSTKKLTEVVQNDSKITELFIPRTMWGGKQPLYTNRTDLAFLIIVKHTGEKICFDFKSCSKRVKEIQKYNMEVQKMPDIEYNFLIGGDGRIYVGRDWFVQNEDLPETVDIAFIGNFTENLPAEKMIQASRQLIILGSAIGALDYDDLFIVCHNQIEKTDSPGTNLCRQVTKWAEYSDMAVPFEN